MFMKTPGSSLDTVDGRNPAPTSYRVFYVPHINIHIHIPNGSGCLPSTWPAVQQQQFLKQRIGVTIYCQPKQCIIMREIPRNHHRSASPRQNPLRDWVI